ncbi:MAG: hypothetical protein WDO24_21325 [Pseudomonadota bacterium]
MLRVAWNALGALRILQRLLHHRIDEAVERLLHLVDQLLQLGIGRVARERVAHRLFGGAQVALAQPDLALLDMDRGVPQQALHRLDRALAVSNTSRARALISAMKTTVSSP